MKAAWEAWDRCLWHMVVPRALQLAVSACCRLRRRCGARANRCTALPAHLRCRVLHVRHPVQIRPRVCAGGRAARWGAAAAALCRAQIRSVEVESSTRNTQCQSVAAIHRVLQPDAAPALEVITYALAPTPHPLALAGSPPVKRGRPQGFHCQPSVDEHVGLGAVPVVGNRVATARDARMSTSLWRFHTCMEAVLRPYIRCPFAHCGQPTTRPPALVSRGTHLSVTTRQRSCGGQRAGARRMSPATSAPASW